MTGVPVVAESFDGTKLHAEVMGSGPEIVLAHGLSVSLASWYYQRRDLRDAFRVVAWDHRGHGHSGPAGSGGLSMESLARDCRAVLDQTGVRRCVLVGHSMGGTMAVKFAEMFPEEIGGRVAGLALIDTGCVSLEMLPAGRDPATDWLRGLVASAPKRYARQIAWLLARSRREGSDLSYFLSRYFAFGVNALPSHVRFLEAIAQPASAETITGLLPDLLDCDLSHVLARINIPTLVITGGMDRLTPPAAARRMAEGIRDSRLVVLEKAGHMALMEQPQVVTAHLRAFCSEVLQGGG